MLKRYNILLSTHKILLIFIIALTACLNGCTKHTQHLSTTPIVSTEPQIVEDNVYYALNDYMTQSGRNTIYPGMGRDDLFVLRSVIRRLSDAGYQTPGKIIWGSDCPWIPMQNYNEDDFIGLELDNGDLLLCVSELPQLRLQESIEEKAAESGKEVRFIYRKNELNTKIISHAYISDLAEVYFLLTMDIYDNPTELPPSVWDDLSTDEIRNLLSNYL